MNLTQLEVLVAIAESVGITQSAASHAIANLKAELGVTLLKRSRQGVTPTGVGGEVLHHAWQTISHVEIIRQKAARSRGLAVGKLRFRCIAHVPARVLSRVLREFQQQYPDIEVVLFEGSGSEITGWLENQVVDVVTVVKPEPYPLAAALADSAIHVILPSGHPLAAQDDLDIVNLLDEPFIGARAEIAVLNRFLDDSTS